MNCVLGLDIGTTHSKAIALGVDGSILYEAKAGYPTMQFDAGQSEQDPELVFSAVLQLLQQSFIALNADTDMHRLTAVCLSAAMHSLIAMDNAGNPLTNAYTWADTRSNKQALQLRSLPDAYTLYAATGTPIHPMSPLCKICWLREELPQIFISAGKFISIKEYIVFKLFGRYIIDHSMASATGMFDIHSLQWHAGAIEAAGIDIAQLSTPVPVTHAETELKEEYKKLLGLTSSVPFIMGASDGCLANLGTGAIGCGQAALTIGTSGAVRVVVNEAKPDADQRLFNYILTDSLYVTGGAVSNGGSALKWFAENFLQHGMSSADDIEWMLQLAMEVPVGSGGLIFLPYLSGERAPSWDATARGAFIGLQTSHGRAHLARAVVEGISFALYQVMEAMEETNGDIEMVYASGAFAGSDTWVQLMSDLLNKNIIVSATSDASAIGAAFLGMRAIGQLQDWSLLKQWIPVGRTFIPNDSVHRQYQPYYQIFEGLYPKLKDDFVQLGSIR
ncbi:MAG: gluconokinase [Chitinophagaceae bacterium]